VNAKAKINVPLGTSLTGIAKLPPGSTMDLTGDKFAERSAAWPKVLLVVFFIWWAYAYVDESGLLWAWSDGKHGQMSKEDKERAAKIQADEDAARTNSLPDQASVVITNGPAATTNAPAAK